MGTLEATASQGKGDGVLRHQGARVPACLRGGIHDNEIVSARTTIIEPGMLLNAYCRGIFPMGVERGELSWFSPDPRGVLPIQGFHVPRSVRSEMRNNPFEIRVDTAFGRVIRACGERRETWITNQIIASYEALFDLGYGHCVEAWRDGELVGGLYGVSIGGAYFGESMFSRESGASKAALIWLMNHLRGRGFLLHDTQWTTPHLAMFGGEEIPRKHYLKQLGEAIRTPTKFVD